MISKNSSSDLEETFEEHLGSWEQNQEELREARRSAAMRRLYEITNP